MKRIISAEWYVHEIINCAFYENGPKFDKDGYLDTTASLYDDDVVDVIDHFTDDDCKAFNNFEDARDYAQTLYYEFSENYGKPVYPDDEYDNGCTVYATPYEDIYLDVIFDDGTEETYKWSDQGSAQDYYFLDDCDEDELIKSVDEIISKKYIRLQRAQQMAEADVKNYKLYRLLHTYLRNQKEFNERKSFYLKYRLGLE